MAGSAPSVPQTDYAAQSKAAIDQQNNQANITAQQNAAANARADAQAAQVKQDAATAKANAQSSANAQLMQKYNNALGYGQGQLGITTGGGNDYGLMQHFTDLVNNAKNNVNIGGINSDSDISAALAPIDSTTLYNTASSDIQNQQRAKLNSALSGQYGDNYANTAIGDDYLKNYESQLLDSQGADAEKAVQEAYARGTLNDSGKTYAEGQLSTQRNAAQGTLNNLANGIISKYRQGLTDAVNAGQKSASGWTFGSSYDPSQTTGRINSLLAGDASSAQSDLASALGSTSLFDTSTALAKAGNYMGTTSGTTGTAGTGTSTAPSDALTSAFASAVSNNAAQKRLLGNQGVA